MKILGTGLNGLVGSRIVELLQEKHTFENISRSTGVDITNKEEVKKKIAASDASVVFHLASKTNVDGCEKDKEIDTEILGYKDTKKQEEEFTKEQTAWAINVIGTQNVVLGCEESKKLLFYISTDFVFDGKKDWYDETDTPNPINWYGQTKYQGELLVHKSSEPWLIVRIAYPYRAKYEKNDFMRIILSRLQNNQPIQGVTDHIFTPTFIDDVAHGLDLLLESNVRGIYHVVGNQSLSPFDAANTIADTFSLSKENISKTTRREYFKNGAQRPFQLSLKNDKIEKLGVSMKTFKEGVEEIKRQLV